MKKKQKIKKRSSASVLASQAPATFSGQRASLNLVRCVWCPRKERKQFFQASKCAACVKEKIDLVFVVYFSLFLSFVQTKERKCLNKNSLVN